MSTMPDFSKTTIFNGLSTGQLALVQEYLEINTYQKGSVIIKENTQGSRLYVLTSGKVTVTKNLVMDVLDSQETEAKRLATLDGKDMPSFGENGLITNGLRTANVIAEEDCTVFELSGESFNKIVEKDIHTGYLIVRNISSIVCKRLEDTDKNVVKLATALFLAVGARN
ncbi:MAG: cyclic nucleotide-binding domain-containing protein [Candidatus Cloacimonetes bacterium]|nr:cyclic nucleotide-binding domain-containing protein [Candidatus Cloacimonadota bacterium]